MDKERMMYVKHGTVRYRIDMWMTREQRYVLLKEPIGFRHRLELRIPL